MAPTTRPSCSKGRPPSIGVAPGKRQHHSAAADDGLLDAFRRALEQEGGARLFLRHGDGADRRIVETLQIEQVAAIVEDGDRHSPAVLQRFRFGRRSDRLGVGKGQALLIVH